MRKLILLVGLLLATGIGLGDINDVPLTQVQPKIVQDVKSHVIYYLETDRRHVSAITPEGRLLWCCEVIPPGKPMTKILDIVCEEYAIKVRVQSGGVGIGHINKRTGIYSPPIAVF